MESKKFLIFRIIIITVSVFLLIYIDYYQKRILEEEKKVEEKNLINEDVVIDASKLYISNNQDYYSELINEKNLEIRINTDDLVKNKLINNNNDYKGYISIVNDEFKYVNVDNSFLDNINSRNYVSGLNNEKNAYDLKYIYKGLDPNNYLKYKDKLYRMIGITNSNNIKVIELDNTKLDYWGLSGDINYLKTSDNTKEASDKGIYYVGFVRSETNSIDQIMKNEKRNNTYTVSNPKLYYDYSYVNISDIINASDNCTYSKVTDINSKKCDSYLINILSNTYTSNSAEGNMIYKVNENKEIVVSSIEKNINVKKVSYFSLLDEYVKGDGTKENPYEIKRVE